MKYLEIKSDLSLLGIKIGMSSDKCIEKLGPNYIKSHRHNYTTNEYFDGGIILFFDDGDKLISIEIDVSLSDKYTIHYDGVPIFTIPRDVLINILTRKNGEDYLDISDNNFIKSKDGLLLWSEDIFDYSELENPYFKRMPLEDKIKYYNSIFISSFSIGNLNEC